MSRKEFDPFDCGDAVSMFFELSYAQYLTVPRSILEAMPQDWQKRFAKLFNELDNTFEWRPKEGRYYVQLKDGKGKYVHDPLMEYRRADREYIESLKVPTGHRRGE
jgi:hypothetical protein